MMSYDDREYPEPLRGCQGVLIGLGIMFIVFAVIVAFLVVVEWRNGR